MLIIINLIVNYLLLRASAAITGYCFRTWRILIASFAGGIFSLVVFIKNIPLPLNVFIKILMFAVMVLTAFGSKNVKSFLKCSASFALVNFSFAGIMLAISTFILPSSTAYINGVVYFDISLLNLTVCAIICYCILSLGAKLTKSKVPQKSIYEIKIHYESKSAEGMALFDSGNTLCDCFSGRPVIIAEKEFIKNICQDKELTSLKNFRLIPYSTINNSGALPSFMAEKTEIRIKGKWVEAKDIYIAVTDKKIISGSYSALFGVPYFETAENSIKGGMITI